MNGNRSGGLVVFDLDGTLIDSRCDLAESANQMLASYGASPLGVDQVTAMVGDGARVLVQRALAAAGLDRAEPEALARFLAIYDRELLVHTRPYTGIVQAIHSAARLASLALLTNKPEGPARRLLDAFDLSRSFRWVIGGDSRFPRKPDPAGLRSLLAASGTEPRAALLVGDSMVDVETARRAGIRMCVALYGFGRAMALAGDELLLGHPADLTDVLGQFLGSQTTT